MKEIRNRIKLNNKIIDNPVALGPMAGITDKTERNIARSFGANLIYTEMISAKALSYKNIKTEELMDITGEEKDVIVQIFGSEPDIMAEAALKAESKGALAVDINMGCPVPKVVKNHEGSALLENPKLAADIVKAMVKAIKIPVTVKMRIGMSEKNIVAVDFARKMADAGASLIAVHGRTREQYYSGLANWDIIADVKKALTGYDVSVIANGDIRTPEDAINIIDKTNCDGIMIARGALGDPFIFTRINNALDGKEIPDMPTAREKVEMALYHTKKMMEEKPEDKAITEMRKHMAWYLKGLPKTAPLKEKLFHCVDYSMAEEMLLDYVKYLT